MCEPTPPHEPRACRSMLVRSTRDEPCGRVLETTGQNPPRSDRDPRLSAEVCTRSHHPGSGSSEAVHRCGLTTVRWHAGLGPSSSWKTTSFRGLVRDLSTELSTGIISSHSRVGDLWDWRKSAPLFHVKPGPHAPELCNGSHRETPGRSLAAGRSAPHACAPALGEGWRRSITQPARFHTWLLARGRCFT